MDEYRKNLLQSLYAMQFRVIMEGYMIAVSQQQIHSFRAFERDIHEFIQDLISRA